MNTKRTRQVSEVLKAEISDIIRTRVKDPRIGFITVTEISLSKDLRHGRVSVSVLGDEKQKNASIEGLQNAHAFIQKEIAARIRLRYIPVLHFVLDTRFEDFDHIERLIREIKNQQTTPEDEDNTSPI